MARNLSNLSVNDQFKLVSEMIERDGDNAYKATAKEIDLAADDMVFLAQKNAPADRYNLENAIVRTNPRDKSASRQARDPSTGRYMPLKVEVYVKDEVIDQETGKEVNVKGYAVIMEESDRYNPSRPGNIAKRAVGGDPGRKYMERAYIEVMSNIYRKIKARVSESL